jgi:hypothetical protein
MLVGMTAGSRIGASLGARAGVVGGALGGFAGAVGGAVVASIPGRKLDIWLMRRGIAEKRKELRQSLITPNTGDFETDYKRAGEELDIMYEYDDYRAQLVNLMSSFYMKNLSIQSEDEAEQTDYERTVAKKELNQQRAQISAIFKADQKMYQSIIKNPATSKALKNLIITLENQVVLAAGVIEAQFLQANLAKYSKFQRLPPNAPNAEGLENIH